MAEPIISTAIFIQLLMAQGLASLVAMFESQMIIAEAIISKTAKASITGGFAIIRDATNANKINIQRALLINASQNFHEALGLLNQVAKDAKLPADKLLGRFGLCLVYHGLKEKGLFSQHLNELEAELAEFDENAKAVILHKGKTKIKVATMIGFGLLGPVVTSGIFGAAKVAEYLRTSSQQRELRQKVMVHYGISNTESQVSARDPLFRAWLIARSIENFIEATRKIPK